MIVIPAIDLKDGQCVRLAQGDFHRVTVYDRNPLVVAQKWQEAGAERIHVVDLDGSLAGHPRNREVVADIVRTVGIPVELGGGIRDMATIEDYLDLGVHWVVLGTAAIRDEAFVTAACRTFPGHIIIGIDAADGRVAIHGWTEQTTLTAGDIARKYAASGIEAIIYTDVKRDGMRTGVNIDQIQMMATTVNVPIIASGGVAGLADIAQLMALNQPNITGVIVGRALYDGTLDLPEAIRLTKHEGPGGNA